MDREFFRLLKARVGHRRFRIYTLHVLHNLRQAEIARRLGLHRCNVCRAIADVKRAAAALRLSLRIRDVRQLAA